MASKSELPEFRSLARKIPFIGTLEVRHLDHSNIRLSGCEVLHELLYSVGLLIQTGFLLLMNALGWKRGNYYRWTDEFLVMYDEICEYNQHMEK